MNCPPLLCFRSNRTGFHYQSFLIMRTFSGNLRNLQIFFFLLFSPESRTRYSLLNLCLRKSAEMKETNLTLAEMWFFSEGWGFAQCSSTLETSYLGCWKQNSRWDFTRWWIPEMVRGGGTLLLFSSIWRCKMWRLISEAYAFCSFACIPPELGFFFGCPGAHQVVLCLLNPV